MVFPLDAIYAPECPQHRIIDLGIPANTPLTAKDDDDRVFFPCLHHAAPRGEDPTRAHRVLLGPLLRVLAGVGVAHQLVMRYLGQHFP